MRKLIALLLAAVVVAGCAETGNETRGESKGKTDTHDTNCLTADQVQAEVDKIANGFETSDEEVEAKSRAIRAVRSREC